jgi:hypothetical protein
LENIGDFNPLRLEKMVKVVNSYKLLTKEHNGDYLSQEQIKNRTECGLESINLAPEFGVMQTRLILERLSEKEQEEAYRVCEGLKKYKKWIPTHLQDAPPKGLVVQVSGHYAFTKEPFASHADNVRGELEDKIYERLDSILSCWGTDND